MRKKNNPEQETEQPAEQQEETQAEMEENQQDTEEAEEETEAASEEAGEESEQAEEGEDQAQEQQEETAASGNDDRVTSLERDLLQARGELAAYRAGVAPGMVADAVTLAMAEAARSGEVTESSVTKAMEAVLKRHPEWKVAEGSQQKNGGFKLGADRDNGGSYKKPANNASQNTKRWNRFKN